jgi:hypothetical protein
MSKKPRGDSKLDALNGQQQALLAEWLTLENLTYEEAQKRVLENFGVSTTRSALCRFYARFAAPWKYTQAAGEAESFAELMEGKYDEATIKRTKQLAFEALVSPQPDVKSAKALLKIVGDSAKLTLQQQKLQLDSRKVAILEAKASLADQATKIANDQQLTEEEQAARMRALFRM